MEIAPTFQSIKIMNSNTNVNYLKLNPYFSHYSSDIGVWLIFLCGVMCLKNIIHVYRSIICIVEYNQCCVYSKINTYETLTHYRCSDGVCSKNNWNTECILNMRHTPIFGNIVWFINLNYLLNGKSVIMGENEKYGWKFLFTAIICIFGWVFIGKNSKKTCQLRRNLNFFSFDTLKSMALTEKDSQPQT